MIKYFSKQYHKILHSLADKFGITISTLCIIECTLRPVLLTVLSLGSVSGVFHYIFALLVIPASGTGVFNALKSHRNVFVISLLIVGALLILYASFFLGHDDHGTIFHPDLHLILIYAGGIALISGHLLNYKLCKVCAI